MRESLTELSSSIEELQVATETLRKQNEELMAIRWQIAAERQYYQELFEYDPNCCLVTTKDGTIREVNQQASKLLNVSAKYLTNKSLAVFIPVAQKSQYYNQLNQLRSGDISNATWQLDIMPRKQQPVTSNCKVVAIRDSEQNILNLRWCISTTTNQTIKSESKTPLSQLAKSDDKSEFSNGSTSVSEINSELVGLGMRQEISKLASGKALTSILIDNLRYPLYNLTTQLVEISHNQINTNNGGKQFNGRFLEMQHDLKDILHHFNNAYILDRLKARQDLQPSIIDYTVFCQQIIRQIEQRNNTTQQIIFDCSESYGGICDVFLLDRILCNLLDCSLQYSPADSVIEVKLSKKESYYIVIEIANIAQGSFQAELAQMLQPLVHQDNLEQLTAANLELAVVKQCAILLQSAIELEYQPNSGTIITVMLPLKMNL